MNKTLKKFLPWIIVGLVVITAAVVTIVLLTQNNDKPNDTPAEYAADQDYLNALGGVSETFKGTVSTESYDTAEKAAKDFVSKELVGKSTANVEEVKNVETYTVSNVDVTIPSEFLEGATNIEKMEVTYSIKDESNDVALMSENITATKQTVVVYVIKYNVNYKYFVPLPETGETISKSYYDSIFNQEKYSNCTFSTVLETIDNRSAGFEGESIIMNTTTKFEQTIKYEGKKVLIYQKTTVIEHYEFGEEIYDNENVTEINAYIEESDDGKLTCYLQDGEQWIECPIKQIGFNTIEELRPFYKEYFDYTYFLKTDYGFAFNQEAIEKYIYETYIKGFQDLGGGRMGENGVSAIAKYYVQNGTLSGMQLNLSSDFHMPDDLTGTMHGQQSVIGSFTCSNYGTTQIEKPNVA